MQPDITLCGSLEQAKAIALLCQHHNVRYSPLVWDSAIGIAAAVHFMAAVPDYPHTNHPALPAIGSTEISQSAFAHTADDVLRVSGVALPLPPSWRTSYVEDALFLQRSKSLLPVVLTL